MGSYDSHDRWVICGRSLCRSVFAAWPTTKCPSRALRRGSCSKGSACRGVFAVTLVHSVWGACAPLSEWGRAAKVLRCVVAFVVLPLGMGRPVAPRLRGEVWRCCLGSQVSAKCRSVIGHPRWCMLDCFFLVPDWSTTHVAILAQVLLPGITHPPTLFVF